MNINAPLHVVRNFTLVGLGLVALIVGLAIVDVPLALLVGLMILGPIAVVMPLFVIYSEQHEDRVRHSGRPS